jgi:glycosyltransferase involved in cell wall biosynthesis
MDEYTKTERNMAPSRAVRVLHVHGNLVAGGGQILSREWLKSSDPERIVPYVVVLDDPMTLADSFRECGISVTKLSGSRVSQIVSLAKFIKRNKIDVVHSQSEPDRKVAHWACLLTRTPVIAHVHSEWVWWSPPVGITSLTGRIRSSITRGLRRLSDRQIVHYIPTSDSVYRAYAPFVKRAMTTIEPGVTLPQPSLESREKSRALLGVSPNQVMILNVSRFDAQKNLADFVSAIDKISSDVSVKAFIVGEGPLKDDITKLVSDKNLDDVITLVDPQGDLEHFYSAADIYLAPSLSESFGMSVAEAMSWGINLIAYDLDAYKRYPAHSYIGVPIGDIDRLAVETLRVIRDPSIQEIMRSAAMTDSHKYDIRKGSARITELDEMYGHNK